MPLALVRHDRVPMEFIRIFVLGMAFRTAVLVTVIQAILVIRRTSILATGRDAAREAIVTILFILTMFTESETTNALVRLAKFASLLQKVALWIEASMGSTIARIDIGGRKITAGDTAADTTIRAVLEFTGTEDREPPMASIAGMVKTKGGPGPNVGVAMFTTVGTVTLMEVAESGMIIHLDVLAR